MSQPNALKWPRVLRSRYGRVTIYRHKKHNTDEFTVTWYVGNKRVRETTTDCAVAQGRAQEILSAFREGNPPREPRKREPKSQKSWSHLIGDVSMEEVVKHYASTHNLLPSITAENVCKRYISVKANSGISARYRQTLQQHLNKFVSVFGSRNVSSISTNDVGDYLSSIPDMRTRFNHRVSLGGMFKWAIAQNFLLKSPVDGTEQPKFKTKTPELFSPSELQKLRDASDDQTFPMLVAGAYSGIRMSEIERLRWSDVNWEERAFVLGPEITKTNRGRVAYFPQCVEGKLRNLAVLAKLKDREKLVQGTCVENVAKLTKASGVAWKKNGLRKTYISCRIALTRNAAEVAEQCGNSPTVIQQNYKGLVTKSEAESWFSALT